MSAPSRRKTRGHFRGCLLGGAVGDTLGAAVEFASLREIRRSFGPDGLTGYASAYGRPGAITDDTQMTLFTAEGLIRAADRFADRGICSMVGCVERSYLRWLHTQGARYDERRMGERGWLLEHADLHQRRAPGNTCLSALDAALRAGPSRSPARPAANDSKGCGGVMRVAPVGLVCLEPLRDGTAVAVTGARASATGALLMGLAEPKVRRVGVASKTGPTRHRRLVGSASRSRRRTTRPCWRPRAQRPSSPASTSWTRYKPQLCTRI